MFMVQMQAQKRNITNARFSTGNITRM